MQRSAAAAIIPPPLIARAAASMPPSDGRRVSELLGGLGAAGIAKAGATALVAAARELGCTVDAPFQLLAFLALSVIPKLKLTDHGLVDVDRFEIVPLAAP